MRAGIIHTPHGDIKTPAFIGAATRASVKAITHAQMRELGSQGILANTYHLILAPGPDLIEKAGGNIVGRMAILAEGDAQDRKDIIYLEKLPLFHKDGSVIE